MTAAVQVHYYVLLQKLYECITGFYVRMQAYTGENILYRKKHVYWQKNIFKNIQQTVLKCMALPRNNIRSRRDLKFQIKKFKVLKDVSLAQ